MLAAPGALPAGEGWAFEFKFDGVRAITYVEGGSVRALSRNGNDVTTTYPELGTLGGLLAGHTAVLDGEVVALQAGDRPSFARLAARIHVARPSSTLLTTVPVVYYAFDLLHLDGRPLIDEPYEQRRERLAALGLDGETVRTPPHFTGADGTAVLRAAELAGLEGVVAKRLGSPYRPGKRSADWTKVPLIRTQEALIIGWKPGEGRRAGTIGSLLLGVYNATDNLVFAGHVGTGFTDVMLRQLSQQLASLHRSAPAVADVPREHARHARWVEPVLVGEVAFRNWTPEGRLRHPSWRGLRSDRSPRAARRRDAPLAEPPAPRPVPQRRETVEGALETPDGRWRVEVVRRGRDQFYRLMNVAADNSVDGLSITTLQRLLAEAGVDMADLLTAGTSIDRTTGAA
ncbi:non-homologous end-joining DNA ligase [Actinoplanes sp. NEAU-A11]|uniref:DNA ligase (ATP) n=2 Tax=Actinoplanes aureus TaxID=2792083 RepID=A0A931CFX2_9ACTN|nr:non-homologous end-joining DNA ligase [Actinoplanes aureus]